MPPPSPKVFKGLPVPAWFNEEGYHAFHQMQFDATDVVMVSYPKTGTTWLHKMVHSLLRMDAQGVLSTSPETDIGFNNQVYPDALPTAPRPEPHPIWGTTIFPELLSKQPPPRVFNTHLTAELLPPGLSGEAGKGRVIYMTRNPKDTLTSLHFFRGEPKDGWTGNEHGAGSYYRFLDPETPNAFGSYFAHVKGMERFVEQLGDRALLVCYEECQEDLDAQLQKLATFLNVDLTAEKLAAVKERVSLKSMKEDTRGLNAMLVRKGEVGDWQNHLDADKWAQVDTAFEERLGQTKVASRLKKFMG